MTKSVRSAGEHETPISVRFDPQMIARLDRVAKQLSRVNPNIRIGRSSVVKLAMEWALSAIESELGATQAESRDRLR